MNKVSNLASVVITEEERAEWREHFSEVREEIGLENLRGN